MFDRRLQKKPHGSVAEKKTAQRLGMNTVPASGAMYGVKGDITSDQFLIENKSTVNESLGVKKSWLHKIETEATELGKRPALAVQFVNARGDSSAGDRWVMIREIDYQELINP